MRRCAPSCSGLAQRLTLLAGVLVMSLTTATFGGVGHQSSITDRSIEWPSGEELLRVLTLQDYNTRVVVLGTMLLGVAAGAIGSFMLLRKQALLGDALSHAMLPGIGLAFMLAVAVGAEGKALIVLLAGAVVTGVMGIGVILLIRNMTRIKEDAALGIVLSVFFGGGVAVLGLVQRMETGHAAGLESFIYGKTASMLASDAQMIAMVAGCVGLVCLLFYKEFKLLCFDAGYARAQGWPVLWLDIVMMALVVAVTVIGLQAVGLILIIALLIIPAAAARFWTQRLLSLLLVSAAIGGISAMTGAAMSALFPRLPSGAMIVVVATAFFFVSMIFAPARGVLMRWLEHRQLTQKVAHQQLLRELYEQAELQAQTQGSNRVEPTDVSWNLLGSVRSWPIRQVRQAVRQARRAGLVREADSGTVRLSEGGLREAARITRNHRLWELYLITHADVAASHVDRDADQVEHVLGSEVVQQLERLLTESHPTVAGVAVPPSPHELEPIEKAQAAKAMEGAVRS